MSQREPEIATSIYPEDALAQRDDLDAINSSEASTLDEMFRERVRRSPETVAYSQYDAQSEQWTDVRWADVAAEVERWQVAFRDQGLVKGDRVAICYQNSVEWVIFDQAALRLGLVVVPLYTADRADNLAYVIADSRSKLVFLSSQALWTEIAACDDDLACVETVVLFQPLSTQTTGMEPMLTNLEKWLPETGMHLERGVTEAEDLATIVYTSGTTGRPKGVMLSHQNILSNAYNGMRSVALTPQDRLLSFLPLSHTLERTVGYYAAMLSAARVVFNRSIPQLSDDLVAIKPTVLISVPRIFERIHNQIYAQLESAGALKRGLFKRAIKTGWHRFQYQQGIARWHPRLLAANLLDHYVAKPVRERVGGELNYVIVGGAPLSIEVAQTFIALGIPLLQGYGLTECSPVVSVNTLARNRPDSIGLLLRGVDVKIAENEELCVKGDNVMLGYWGRPDATADVLQEADGETWLHTGDRASIDAQGFLRIIGRIKDILVLANGEKIPPADLEGALMRDVLFEQAMVIGEGRSFLSALVVLNMEQWRSLAKKHGWTDQQINEEVVQEQLLKRVAVQMREFPGYARIRKLHCSLTEWTIESGLLTPTLKVKRPKVLQQFQAEVDALYHGHGVHKT